MVVPWNLLPANVDDNVIPLYTVENPAEINSAPGVPAVFFGWNSSDATTYIIVSPTTLFNIFLFFLLIYYIYYVFLANILFQKHLNSFFLLA